MELTMLYAGMALSMAVAISWLMDRAGFERYLMNDLAGRKSPSASIPLATIKKTSATQCCSTPQNGTVAVSLEASGIGVAKHSITLPESISIKIKRLFDDAVGQFRSFLPHVLIGVLIGAIAHGFVPDEWLVQYAGDDNIWAVPIAAIVGVPLYVRGSTMIPIAVTLTAKGMSVGAVIALVVGGAGASLPEMVMLKRMFQWPILIAFLFSVFGIAITTGYLAQALF
jgi:uncharacterized membrane protein YraQ (UPF0718 family)